MSSVFVTSGGIEVPVEEVSLLLMQKVQIALEDEYKRNGFTLEPPQYCVTLPDGSEQCYPHDETSIADEKTSAAEKAEWKAYQDNTTRFKTDLNDRMFGVVIMDQPIEVDDRWETKLRWLGVEIPENEFDRKLLYVTTQLLKTPEDMRGYFIAVFQESSKGVDATLVEAAKGMFSGTA